MDNMAYYELKDQIEQATTERDQLKAALARVLKACDLADSYDQGQRGHWISTSEIRAAADGTYLHQAGQPLPAEIWPGAKA